MEHKGVLAAITAFFTMLTAWLGALAIPVYVLVGCNIIDYVTGIMAARRRGEKVSSEIGLNGIIKKVCQWLLVIVGWMLDVIIDSCVHRYIPEFEAPIVVSVFVAFWLVANEMLSIIENIDDIGVPIPGFLKKGIAYFLHSTENKADGAIPDIEVIDLNDEAVDNDTDVPEE